MEEVCIRRENMGKSNTYDADSISVLEGLEAVRKRPGMYIGSVSTKGLNHLIYEIVDNAVDEHLAGFCKNIHVTLEKDGSATVEDDGRGVPVGMHQKGISAARLVYTTLHAGGKFDDSAYKTSGGLHGVGSSVVNALSVYMDVQISREGYIHHDRYERGVPVVELEDGLLPTIGKTRKTGTKVNFLPDDTIFEKTKFRAEEVKSRLHETAYLNPELTIVFDDKRPDSQEHIEYHEPDGILGFIRDLNQKKEVLHDPIYFKGTAEGIEVEAAFQYVNDFSQIVCRDTRCHSDCDSFRSIDKKIRNPHRKYQRFFFCLIKVRSEINDILVQIRKVCLLSKLGQTCFCITHGSCSVAFDGTKISMSVHQHHSLFEVLCHNH